MSWRQRTLEKARAIHSEIAQLRMFLNESAVDAAAEGVGHLFDGHYDALDDVYLDSMPVAAALDLSDLVLFYHESDRPKRQYTFHKLTSIVRNIHKEIMNVVKTHRNFAGCPTTKWQKNIDLVVTAADPRLFFGFKLPETGTDAESPNLVHFEDPLYVAVKDSVELLGAVSAALHDAHPRESISDFTKDRPTMDVAMVDAAIHAARSFIPRAAKAKESVLVGGLALPGQVAVDLGKKERVLATNVLKETKVPDDDAEIVGMLMAVDYGTMRFELRNVENYEVRSVRCQYFQEHESFVKQHGKKLMRVRGKATFDREQKPRFLVVDKIEPRRTERSFHGT